MRLSANNFFYSIFLVGALIFVASIIFFNVKPLAGVIDYNNTAISGLDYNSNYFAAKRILLEDNLYFNDKQHYKFPDELPGRYVYPPLLAYFFIPFSILPYNLAFFIYTLLIVVLFLFSIYILSFYAKSGRKYFFVISSLFLFSPILWLHLERGQTDVIILFLIALGFYLYNIEKYHLTGFVIGLAVLLKLTPIIFLIYFAIKSKKSFFSSIITITFFLIMTGSDKLFDFYRSLSDFAHGVSAGAMSNGILGIFYNKFTESYLALYQAKFLFIIFAILFLLYFFSSLYLNQNKANISQKERNLIEFSCLLLVMITIPSVSWLYNGIYLIFALTAYWNLHSDEYFESRKKVITDGLVYFILSQPLLFPSVLKSSATIIFSLRPLYLLILFLILFHYLLGRHPLRGFTAFMFK